MSINLSEMKLDFKSLFLFALPQMGLMLSHLIISMTDIWVTGKIDSTVQAALGIVAQIFTFLLLIVSIAGAGSLTTISQALGAKSHLKAKRYAGLVFLLAFIAGTFTSILAIISTPLIYIIFNVTDELKPIIDTFLLAYNMQLPFYYTLIMMNSIFRAYTFVKLPFFTILVVAILNFIGSYGFGLGKWGFPDFGYHGVAWSSFGSIFIGFLLNLFLTVRSGIIDRTSFARLRWIKAAFPYLWRVGLPSITGNFAGYIGVLFILSFLTNLPVGGIVSVAGITLASRIEGIILFPVAAFAISITIIAGHLLGSGKADFLYQFGKRSALYLALLILGLSILLYILKEPIIRFFATDEEVVNQAIYFITLTCIALPFKAYSSVAHSIFAGTGATKISRNITLISMWGIQVPLAYLLGYVYHFGAAGIYFAIIVSSIISALITIYLYRKRGWLNYGMKKLIGSKTPL